jgi:hypothetical protein
MIVIIIGILIMLFIALHNSKEKEERDASLIMKNSSLKLKLDMENSEKRNLQLIEKIKLHQFLFADKDSKTDYWLRNKGFNYLEFNPYSSSYDREEFLKTQIENKKKNTYRNIEVKEKNYFKMEISYTIGNFKTSSKAKSSIVIDDLLEKSDEDIWSLYINLFETTEHKFNEIKILRRLNSK